MKIQAMVKDIVRFSQQDQAPIVWSQAGQNLPATFLAPLVKTILGFSGSNYRRFGSFGAMAERFSKAKKHTVNGLVRITPPYDRCQEIHPRSHGRPYHERYGLHIRAIKTP